MNSKKWGGEIYLPSLSDCCLLNRDSDRGCRWKETCGNQAEAPYPFTFSAWCGFPSGLQTGLPFSPGFRPSLEFPGDSSDWKYYLSTLCCKPVASFLEDLASVTYTPVIYLEIPVVKFQVELPFNTFQKFQLMQNMSMRFIGVTLQTMFNRSHMASLLPFYFMMLHLTFKALNIMELENLRNCIPHRKITQTFVLV